MCKTLIGAKPLRIMFDKVDGVIRDYNGTEYLPLFGYQKYNAIFNRSGIYVVSHNLGKITIDSDNDLPLEET